MFATRPFRYTLFGLLYFAQGSILSYIGQQRSVLAALVVSLVAILALSAITGPMLAWPIVLVFGIAFGYYETVYFAVSMDVTDSRIAASMFAILMAVANIGTGIGLGVSGVLADTVGYRWTFVVIALLNLLALPLLPVIFRRRTEA